MTPFPAAPYVVACHAGQAARAEQAAAEKRDPDLYWRGLRVLRDKTPAELADMLDDIHAAIHAGQVAGEWLGVDFDRIDTDPFEDTAAILRNAGRG